MKIFFQWLVFTSVLFLGGLSHTAFAEQQRSSAPLSFEDWSQLAGNYRIKSFDGTTIYDGRDSEISVDKNRYKNIKGAPLTFLNMKLYDEYSSGGSHSWNFGPFKEIGTSSAIHEASGVTFSYECKNETVFIQGNSRQFDLKLTVKQVFVNTDLEISYELKFQGDVSSIQHKFVLENMN